MIAADENLAAVVRTSQGEYRALVGRGIIDTLPTEMARANVAGRVFMLADDALFPVTVRRVQETLESAGITTHVMTVDGGERSKSLATVAHAYDWLAGLRGERGDVMLSLGGGVMGDLAGFTAATWLRGIPFVQVPSTLAAMVDASLGGKTAVNLEHGKNLVGAFHQPRLVLSDIDLLDSLPERELRSGWAEAIKHGLILDERLLNEFESHADSIVALEGERATNIIRRSVAIKAEIVSEDEFETGERRILLNYGHTIGHAIEATAGYGEFLHGEAVSVGMMAAGRISTEVGLISPELLDRQRALLVRFGLPVSAPGLDVGEIVERTRSDKKSRGGAVQWVLLKGPGSATIRRDIPGSVVRSAVEEIARSG